MPELISIWNISTILIQTFKEEYVFPSKIHLLFEDKVILLERVAYGRGERKTESSADMIEGG